MTWGAKKPLLSDTLPGKLPANETELVYLKVTICMTQGPEEFKLAVAL